jgi:hypothetical protein
MLRVRDRLDRARHRFFLGHGTAAEALRKRLAVALFMRDVFGQFEVGGAGPLLLGLTDRLAHRRRDIADRDDLPRVLGQRLHHPHHVDDLEMPLFARLDRLLPGDHQHRHAA